MNLTCVLLLIGNIFTYASLSVATPFFPPLAQAKGLSNQQIGMILSANPIGAILTAIVVGKYLSNSNRQTILLVGLILEALSLLGFAFLDLINNGYLLLYLSLIFRLMSGIGLNCFSIPAFAYIPILFPDDIQKIASYFEVSIGLGYISGCFFGGVLFSFGGYRMPFCVFATLMIISIPLIKKYLRIELQLHSTELQEMERHTKLEEVVDDISCKEAIQEFSLTRIFTNLDVLMTMLMITLVTCLLDYFEPTFANFMIKNYGITQDTAGLMMSILSTAYLIGVTFFAQITACPKYMMVIGFFITGISFWFAGPNYSITHISHNLSVVLVGQAVIGFGGALMQNKIKLFYLRFLPTLNLLNESLLVMYPEQSEQAADMASTIFNFTCGIGGFLGPFLGGLLTEKYDYIDGCTYMGFATLGVGFIYMFNVCLQSYFTRNNKTLPQEESQQIQQ